MQLIVYFIEGFGEVSSVTSLLSVAYLCTRNVSDLINVAQGSQLGSHLKFGHNS